MKTRNATSTRMFEIMEQQEPVNTSDVNTAKKKKTQNNGEMTSQQIHLWSDNQHDDPLIKKQ